MARFANVNPRSPEFVRDEFDRLAACAPEWDWNAHYHPWIERTLPPRVDALLDAGCGAGEFARSIARRCARVVAIDLSPRMIARARASGAPAHVTFELGDVIEAELPASGFDAIVSIAALHHMDLAAALDRLADLLRPGGRLVVVDLHAPAGIGDHVVSAASAALAPPIRWLRSGRPFPTRASRAAWALHEIHDRHATIPEIRRIAAARLAGSVVRRRLFWRYSLTWIKPT
ncbi:MAG TPA: class I SAM-dependent methyltransferase [Candidatus Polarisedimenticolaceae bacterium]